MLFLADESCDIAVVHALRAAGHDVLAVAEVAGQSPDEEVIELAVRGRRVLLTEDKDFGTLVYAQLRRSAGVILLRYPTRVRASIGEAVVGAVERLGSRLRGAFVVVEPGGIRVGRSPEER